MGTWSLNHVQGENSGARILQSVQLPQKVQTVTTITVDAGTQSPGITLGAGDTVSNAGTIVGTAAGVIVGVGGVVGNTGSITGEGANGVGLGAGGTLTNAA